MSEDNCSCEELAAPFYLDIINIYHKPSQMIDFVPSLDRDFIVHGEIWTTDFGKTWSEWDNCIGPCAGCKNNAKDMGDRKEIVISTNRDLWFENGQWIFEYSVKGTSPKDSNVIYSPLNEWWYINWRIEINEQWLKGEIDCINAIEDEQERKDALNKFNQLLLAFQTKGYRGTIRKEVNRNHSNGESMDYKEFILKFEPPPDIEEYMQESYCSGTIQLDLILSGDSVHVPQPSEIICKGDIENFYQQVAGCTASGANLDFLGKCSCGFWELYIVKCLKGDDIKCKVERLWASGRVSKDGILLGLNDRVIPLLTPNTVPVDERPKDTIHIDWILGGPHVSYDTQINKQWECGMAWQPGCDPNDLDDDTNEYKYWYIRVFDYQEQGGQYVPFRVNKDNYVPPPCDTCGQPVPEKILVKCECAPGCEHEMGWYLPQHAEQAKEECMAIVSTRDCCIREPGVKPPRPPVKPPEEEGESEIGWGDGQADLDWTQREEGTKPSWPGGTGEIGWGGGGFPGWGGGPSGPSTPPITIYPPKPDEKCDPPIIILKCPSDPFEDMRKVADDVDIPLRKDIIEVGIDEVRGLVNATYYEPKITTERP